jgi:hypothetical protein
MAFHERFRVIGIDGLGEDARFVVYDHEARSHHRVASELEAFQLVAWANQLGSLSAARARLQAESTDWYAVQDQLECC